MALIQLYGTYIDIDTGEIHVNSRVEQTFSVMEYDKNRNMMHYKTYENIKQTNKMEEDMMVSNIEIDDEYESINGSRKRSGIFDQTEHVAKRDIRVKRRTE